MAEAPSGRQNFALVDEAETRPRLEALARWLDTTFRVLGTSVRIGADALLKVLGGIVQLRADRLIFVPARPLVSGCPDLCEEAGDMPPHPLGLLGKLGCGTQDLR
jgi:hypothetical protein